MSDIQIRRINASLILVTSMDEGIVEDIYHFFRFEEPTFRPNKFSRWDGIVRLYNKKTGELPYGLLSIVLKFCKEKSLTYELDPEFKSDITALSLEEIADWVKTLYITSKGKAIEPYEYQLEAVHLAIKFNRLVALAATSAGKSLIAYILCRYYEQLNAGASKVLLVVPSINLVTQMRSDFEDYSASTDWDTNTAIHCIAEGAVRYSEKPIFISTWQSIQNMPEDWFYQFSSVIVDEVHGATGKKLQYIMNSSINAYTRIGMTGTLKSDKLSPTLIQGCFGPIRRIVKTKELQDAGRAARTKVTMLRLEYPIEDRRAVSNLTYANEIDWLISHPFRNKVIKSLAMGLKGNTLILFDRVEAHLELLFEELKASDPSKHYYMISGEVKNSVRDEIKAITEAGEDIVIMASAGTMSTGVSVRKLHNLVIAHPTKSIVKILQSLGRMIRLHESKEIASIYHLIDDAMVSGRQNYSLQHGLEAYRIYASEEHDIGIRRVTMKGRNTETISLI